MMSLNKYWTSLIEPSLLFSVALSQEQNFAHSSDREGKSSCLIVDI